ncbi:MAG: alpha-ketoacid dehydrogenase subunit beta [SAR202 cluster bacterium]|nr:alpha-ketoacid dehydrogenase subunit beta [SAR202 cluster bacterium]
MTENGATRKLTFVQAINEGIRQEMERDPTVIVMGEDVAGAAGKAHLGFIDHFGGSFGLTKNLIQKFGPERVRDTPISETGFIGAGVGAAATGLRPLVDLMFVGFVGVCGDQIFNNAAKMHYMFGGKVKLPLTIQCQTGAGHGSAAQHSESLYALFTHIPGLKCVVPSDPYTAKGLQIAAIRDDDPVVVFQSITLMGMNFDVNVPEEPYTWPIGKARVAREGKDITLVGIGYTTQVCLQAAGELAKRGHSAEVVDLLSLSPLDEETILGSVRKTRKAVVVDEDYPRCSVASDIAALVGEQAFDVLDAPPKRLTAPHASVPYSPVLEALHVPSKERVVEAALSVLK